MASEKYLLRTEGECLCALYLYTPRDARKAKDEQGGPWQATVYVSDRRINSGREDSNRNRFAGGVDKFVCCLYICVCVCFWGVPFSVIGRHIYLLSSSDASLCFVPYIFLIGKGIYRT